MKPLLLCTDLDRTLLPNGKPPESPQAREHFRRFVAQPPVRLAYVTGRDLSLVQQAIEEYTIPIPDFALTDVGSSAYQIQDGEWQRLSAWDEILSTIWPESQREKIAELLNGQPLLRLQEAEKQERFKLSFYVDLPVEHRTLVKNLYTFLKQHQLSAHLIWSEDEELNVGLLDVLPDNAGKREAIEFLMQHLGFDDNNTVFAGDSGNDLDVMLSPIPSILVANAADSIREEILKQKIESVYFAQGGYLGMNGCYSAGILEGVAHYLKYSL